MIVVENQTNQFSPFIICKMCGKRITGRTGLAAYLPNMENYAPIIFVHKSICLDQADRQFGRLNVQLLEHHLHMLLHNTKITFTKDDLQTFKLFESI